MLVHGAMLTGEDASHVVALSGTTVDTSGIAGRPACITREQYALGAILSRNVDGMALSERRNREHSWSESTEAMLTFLFGIPDGA